MKDTDLKSLLILGLFIFLLAQMDSTPGPTPDPPTPDVDPSPFPADKLSVLIVEETSQRRSVPPSQLNAMLSVSLREFVTRSGGEIRVFDKDIDAQFEAEKWREALTKPRDSLPWILISNGSKGYSGPLPEDIDAIQTLIEKYK